MQAQYDVPHDLNLAEFFLDRRVAEGRGERSALIADGQQWSYTQLAALTNRVGNALLELGVRRGDRVLLALADSPEFVATWYAVQKIGAVTAEVYTFLQAKDYAYYLRYTEPVVVAVDATTLPRIREAAARAGRAPMLLCLEADVRDLRAGEVHFDTMVGRQPGTLMAAPTAADDVAIWKFTTGSTGQPKACVHPARTPFVSHRAYALGVLDLRDDDVVLPVPKLFFGYARDLAALFPFGVGAAGVIFRERCTPALVFELIARHRPTILVNVPTMMQAMLDEPGASRQDLGCLRLCTSAGEALPEPLHRRWLDVFGVEVLDGIGSSEAYHIYISNRPGRVRVGSMGECVPGYTAEVVDPGGAPVADGETGRLWIRGGTIASGYWGDEPRSRDTFAGDLVMSGDLVARDGDGYFWYRGRADDLLKIGGIWVAPLEIERCIAAHADVTECAVVGVDSGGLTLSCAYVVTRPGSAPLSAEEVQEFVRRSLSPHKVPRVVRLVSELPKTGSGKVDRRTLQERAHQVVAGGTAGS